MESIQRTCYIYSGIPGSGKTTHIASRFGGDALVVSADRHFEDEQGNYTYDPDQLDEAHQQCLRNFIFGVQNRHPTIVVDNCNIHNMDIAVYRNVARAYGYNVIVVVVECSPVVAFKRCVHGVPWERLLAMYQNIKKRPEVMKCDYEHVSN